MNIIQTSIPIKSNIDEDRIPLKHLNVGDFFLSGQTQDGHYLYLLLGKESDGMMTVYK
jgi:hypothetical protein